MAKNLIYNGNDELNRARVVPAGTVSGDPVINVDRPAVAITSRGDTISSTTVDGLTYQHRSGGFSNKPGEATLAFDGTYEFAVTGATASTGNQVKVYAVVNSGTGAVTSLTTTATGNTLFGVTDYPNDYYKRAGIAPVRIGA